MDPKRWETIKAILDQVFDLEEAERDTALERLCGTDGELRREVESLIDADREADAPRLFDEPMPERIGPFRLERELGAGGMGVVYLAHQEEPIRRAVAIKLIKAGMDTREVVSRFEQERQTLALMQHPGIANVIDAGSTENGRPYFVMEYVDGVPITEYCDRERLDARRRLALFAEICQAVQHAHQKGVIHRDIKPSNVLVVQQDGAPAPKIIDFGIAKATRPGDGGRSLFTDHGRIIGTPEYMSPEQASLSEEQVDTRTDVYSLGVLLYELLVGVRPFSKERLRDAAFDELLRIIREEEPQRPSARFATLHDGAGKTADRRGTDPGALARELRRDLDWIVMRALEKEPARRYGTVSELAGDIGRYLRDEPVQAGPPSVSYRARKFVRRHRLGVAAAAVVLLGLVLGAAGALGGLVQARRAEARAQSEAQTAEQVSRFLSDMLQNVEAQRAGAAIREDLTEQLVDPQAPADFVEGMMRGVNFTDTGIAVIDREILTRAAETIEAELGEQPEVASLLYRTLGVTYQGLGLHEPAETLLRRAWEMQKAALGEEALETLHSRDRLGSLLSDRGRLDEARSHHAAALAGLRRAAGPQHDYTLRAINNMGLLLYRESKFDEAEAYHLEHVEVTTRRFGREHPETLTALDNLAVLRRQQNDLEGAEAIYREVLDLRRRVIGPEHRDTLATVNNLAVLLLNSGELTEAESLARECLEGRQRVLGDEHPYTLLTARNLADVFTRQQRHDEAIELVRGVLEVQDRTLDADHLDRLHSLHALGYYHNRAGRPGKAEPYFAEAAARRARLLGEDATSSIYSRRLLGSVRLQQGRYEEAERDLRDSLERAERIVPGFESYLARIRHELGHALVGLERWEEAQPLVAAAAEYREANTEADDPDRVASRELLDRIHEQLGR